MVSFFLMPFIGFTFYLEHQWNTWDRLRTTPLSTAEIAIGKLLPSFGVVCCQLGGTVLLERLAFGVRVKGSLLGFSMLLLAMALAVVALAFLLVVLCRTILTFDAVVFVIALVGGALGGGFTPSENLLPGWAHLPQHAMPAYWAVAGLRAAFFGGNEVHRLGSSTLALLGFALAFGLLGALLFRPGARRESWA
jgi:ABC-2 type transport system permease protein